MEPGAVGLILVVVLMVIIFSFFRGRGGVRNRPEVVQNLLYDIKLDQVLLETFYKREKPKKFEKSNWEINKSRIGFLGESLKETLRMTFGIVDELNQEIKLVKKGKMGSHKDINVSPLAQPLAKCREGLEGWLMDTLGVKEVPPRYPSMMGFLFGER